MTASHFYDYSLPFLDQLMTIVKTSTLVAYTLYTISGGITRARRFGRSN